jgi:hypothetical protein
MTITPTFLTRAAGLSAVAAGLLFIGVQVGHPYLDATTVTTTDYLVRESVKIADGRPVAHRHHRDVPAPDQADRSPRPHRVRPLRRRYLAVLSVQAIGIAVLPTLAATEPGYVNDVLNVATGGTASGDVGGIQTLNQVGGIVFLLGGFLFGIALFRAGILARWAAVVLSVGCRRHGAASRPPRGQLPALRHSDRCRDDRSRMVPVARAAQRGR